MKNKIKVLLILLVLILIMVLVYIYYVKDNNKLEHKKNKTTTAKKIEWNTPSGDSLKINIYYNKNNDEYEVINELDSYNYNLSSYKLINSYRCNINSCYAYKIDNDSKKVIIKDDEYYIYNFINNKAKKLNLNNAYYNSIEILSYDSKIYGLSVSNVNDKYSFYSYKKDKFTTDFIYTNIFSNEKVGLINNNISVSKDDKYYVINYDTKKVIKESNYYLGCFGNRENVYYYENYSDENEYEVLIYNSSFKKILKNNLYKLYSSSKKGNLIVKTPKKETFSIYNNKGLLIKESKEYKEVLNIINDNIIVIDNDSYLKIVDIDGNIKMSIVKMTDDLMYDKLSSKLVNDKIYFSIINTKDYENNQKTYYYDIKNVKKGVLDN